jgi:hypothetical protein
MMEKKDRYFLDIWRGGYRVIVQRASGTANIIGDYLTKEQAQAIKKLMEGNNYGDS